MNYQKGGVAIYKSDNLNYTTTTADIPNLSIELTCETAVVKVKLGHKKTLYLIGIYKTQGNMDTSMNVLTQILDKIPTWNCPVLIMGDINIDILEPNREQIRLEELLKSHNLTRLPLPATRITHNSISSIDCVCTNLNPQDTDTVVINAGISDHTAQLCKLTVLAPDPHIPISYRRHFNQNNISNFKSLIQQESWETVYDKDHVDHAYNSFNRLITTAINLTCPVVKSRVKHRKPTKISDQEANTLKKIYLQAQDAYLLSGSEWHKQDMSDKKKTYDLKLKSLRQQATENYINTAENKSKALWKIINGERKSSKNTTDTMELEVNGHKTQDPLAIAHHLNLFFTNIANDILSKQPKPVKPSTQNVDENSQCIDDFFLHPTNTQEVTQVIKSLKNKSSAGLDDISAKTLKTCGRELTAPLVNIINKSFQQGMFPKDLKIAKVYPKFKKGNHLNVKSYRPISLISTFSKLIEKIVLSRLLQHLYNHNLITKRQHGFLGGRSTTTAIIDLVEFLIDSIEAGNTSTAILIDFSKAFDCLDYSQLLNKMKTMGIKGTAANWFKSYLEGRTQIVELMHTQRGVTQSVRSTPLPVTRGVPQGSVLGPILFILFTNDLPKYLQQYNTTLMYADDTVLLLNEKDPNALEIRSLIALSMAIQYCHNNNLAVNEEKTQQLVFGCKRDKVSTIPNLETPEDAKYLGVTIDQKLSWTPHIDNLCGKLSSSLYVIKRIKCIGNTETAKSAYHALFESHLRYGLTVWGNSSLTNMQRVLIQQKKAIRILAGLSNSDSCRQKFAELKILTVVSLYLLETATYASTLNLMRASDHHNYNTRHAANFTLPAHRLTLYKEKPSYMGAKILNVLPDEAKGRNATTTRRRLTKWLTERPFYCIDEFMNWRTFQ